MIPFGTLEPVVIREHRSWKNEGGQTFRVVRVSLASEPDSEPTEFFVAPGVSDLPAEGEVVHLRYVARAKGWETVVNEATGERRRRNGGTAHSVREFVVPKAA